MMKHTLLYIAVSGMTLLTSCQLGKHYTRPDLHLPQQLDTLRQQDTLSIADMQWWEIYTDTTLQSLIEKTLDNNKDMKRAAARVIELAALTPKMKEVIMVVTTIKMTPNRVVNLP